MPTVEVNITIEVKRRVLFDFLPVFPAFGVIVHVGKWWKTAIRIGPVTYFVSRSPDGWHARFEVNT